VNVQDKFKFEQIIRGDTKVVVFKGTIDEDTDFTPITKLGDSLTFNFKNVESINSLGVRAWVNFVKLLKDKDICFEECPPIIVRQMNMIPSFTGNAKVLSVYVPYVCDNCDSEDLVLVKNDQFSNVSETARCENCKEGEMEFDGTPEQYFAFNK
jgi:anti-anti-sigma regulatory factor